MHHAKDEPQKSSSASAITKDESKKGKKKRAEHEAEAGAGGALAGAAVGAIGGVPGAIAGAVIGAIAGAVTDASMEKENESDTTEEQKLDREIGVSDGELGAPNLKHPPAKIGAYSAASAGAGSTGNDDTDAAEGPFLVPKP